MLVVVRLIAGRLPADVTGERSRPAVHFHMFRQVVRSVERLTALLDLAHEFLSHLVFAHVSLAVVLADELAAAVVAGVGAHGLVRVHVRHELAVADEGAGARRHRAAVGLGRARHVRPAVQLQVPLGGERLVAHHAHVRPRARVCQHVRAQVGTKINLTHKYTNLRLTYRLVMIVVR